MADVNARKKKIRSITLIAELWFDKANGNTYYSGVALVNGVPSAYTFYQYGYGNQYEYALGDELEKNGLIKLERRDHCPPEPLWSYCEKRGITYYSHHSSARNKSQLYNPLYSGGKYEKK